ncbi:MAG: hypothetical protein ACREEX_12150, partial [Caulobacteraceae bacterium]
MAAKEAFPEAFAGAAFAGAAFWGAPFAGAAPFALGGGGFGGAKSLLKRTFGAALARICFRSRPSASRRCCT